MNKMNKKEWIVRAVAYGDDLEQFAKKYERLLNEIGPLCCEISTTHMDKGVVVTGRLAEAPSEEDGPEKTKAGPRGIDALLAVLMSGGGSGPEVLSPALSSLMEGVELAAKANPLEDREKLLRETVRKIIGSTSNEDLRPVLNECNTIAERHKCSADSTPDGCTFVHILRQIATVLDARIRENVQ